MRPILLAHPTGNANVRAAARAFQRAYWLEELHSCICWNPYSPLARLLPATLSVQFNRRSFADVPQVLQHSHPWLEVLRLLGPRFSSLRRHEIGPLSIDSVYRSFDSSVAACFPRLKGLKAVYAYEDAALQTFRSARRHGISTLYELPTGYWRAARKILEEERDLQPDWACTLTGLVDSSAKLARKDEELQLADQVVVASSFVRSTLIDYKACSAPVALLPYGAPPPTLKPPVVSSITAPLKVLFVGSLGQQKGLSYALKAVELLGDQIRLTLIGRPKTTRCRPLMGALERYRWFESLPHQHILEQMHQHDVLLFPTLFDGFGLVITEALSQGLPVIATCHSGAPECIRHGVEGFIVPIRNSIAIAEHLQQLADDRDQLAAMRQACLRRAAELSWAGYEQELCRVVGQTLALDTASP